MDSTRKTIATALLVAIGMLAVFFALAYAGQHAARNAGPDQLPMTAPTVLEPLVVTR